MDQDRVVSELCRGGRLDALDLIAVLSGSSGTPDDLAAVHWPTSVLSGSNA